MTWIIPPNLLELLVAQRNPKCVKVPSPVCGSDSDACVKWVNFLSKRFEVPR